MTIYEQLKAKNALIKHSGNELLTPITPDSQSIVDSMEYWHKNLVLTYFEDQKRWFIIPFAYDPIMDELYEKIK